MPKRKVIFIFIFFLICSPLFGGEWLGEIKVSYFHANSDNLRDMCSEGWANYQAELSYSFFKDCEHCDWWKNFYLWGSVNYLRASGTSIGGLDSTDIHIIPVGLGLKYILPFPCIPCSGVFLYGSAGTRYYVVCVKNTTDDNNDKDHAHGFGGVLSVGTLFQVTRRIMFDAFVDYSFRRFSSSEFSDRNLEQGEGLNVGGWSTGLGAGVKF